MFRQSPRRNGRNNGLKIKHALQISVLLGVSIWLLYLVHHSNDKKAISVETNVNEKPRNDSSKDMLKLGRKDLRPKVMETTIKDSKEAVEHHVDEQGNGNEDEKLAHDHESEEHDETGDNKQGDGREDGGDNEDGIGKITKTEHKEKEHDDTDHDQSGVISDNIQTEHIGEQKEDGRSKKEATKEGDKGNEMENKKESITVRSKESKNEDQGKQKEVKELHKQNEERKVKVNENKNSKQKKTVVMDKIEKEDKSKKEDGRKMSSNQKEVTQDVTQEVENESGTQEVSSRTMDYQQNVTQEVENESGKDDTSSSKGPSVDESQLGFNQSHNHVSSDVAIASKKESQGAENQNNKVETQTVSKKHIVARIIASPVSYLTPSVDHETAASVNGHSTDSNKSNGNEKNEEGDTDSGAQDMEQVPNKNKDDASVLEDEKDALTDLGTLPDNGTGGHITSEDSDTE